MFTCSEEDARKITSIVEYDRTDWRVEKMLREYDKALVAKWLWQKKRWGIFTKDRKGKTYLLYVVKNLDGSYRNVDRRDLITIAEVDLTRKRRAEDLIEEIEAHNEGLEVSKRRKLTDDVIAISKERWRYVFGHPVVNVPLNLKG